MLTETVAALKTQVVLNKVVATLEAEATLTECGGMPVSPLPMAYHHPNLRRHSLSCLCPL